MQKTNLAKVLPLGDEIFLDQTSDNSKDVKLKLIKNLDPTMMSKKKDGSNDAKKAKKKKGDK